MRSFLTIFITAIFFAGFAPNLTMTEKAKGKISLSIDYKKAEARKSRSSSSRSRSSSSFSRSSFGRSGKSSKSLWNRKSSSSPRKKKFSSSKTKTYPQSGSDSRDRKSSSTSSSSKDSRKSKADKKPSKTTSSPSTTDSRKSSADKKPSRTRTTTSSSKSQSSSSSSYKKPADKSKTRTIPKFKTSTFDKKAQKRKASKSVQRYRSETSKFKRSSSSTLRNSSDYRKSSIVTRTPRVSYNTYYQNRDVYYRGMGWSAPRYAYYSSPSFGMWDALFMWSILDSMNQPHYSQMAYHHHNDAGFREWRREADQLAQEDAELKAKLEAMDAQLAKIEDTGLKRDPDYMPEGVDPGVALAAEVVTKQSPDELVMGAGSSSGNYFAFCNMLKDKLKTIKVVCQKNDGSVANITGIVNETLGAGFIQSNVLNKWLKDNPNVKIDALQSTVYPEVVFLIANRQAGISSIKDFDHKKHRLYFAGSGAYRTMAGFAEEDKKYLDMFWGGVQVNVSEKTLQMVASNPNGVMMHVCGMKCDFIRKANDIYGNKLTMAAVDDWDFNNASDQFGNSIYRFVDVPPIYKKLQEGSWISSGAKETLAVDAIFVLSKAWAETAGMDGLSTLEEGLWPSFDMIQTKVGVPEE